VDVAALEAFFVLVNATLYNPQATAWNERSVLLHRLERHRAVAATPTVS